VVIVVVMVAAIMIPQGQLRWTWVFPFGAAACSVYGYLRVRKAGTLVQGSAWTLVQVVFALGAFALIAIPAKS